MERSHLVAEARAWGMPERVARTVIVDAIDRFETGMAAADSEYPETLPGKRDLVVRQFERLAASNF